MGDGCQAVLSQKCMIIYDGDDQLCNEGVVPFRLQCEHGNDKTGVACKVALQQYVQ